MPLDSCRETLPNLPRLNSFETPQPILMSSLAPASESPIPLRKQDGPRAPAMERAYEKLAQEQPLVREAVVAGVSRPYIRGGQHGHYVSAIVGVLDEAGRTLVKRGVMLRYEKLIQQELAAEDPSTDGIADGMCARSYNDLGEPSEITYWLDPEDGSVDYGLPVRLFPEQSYFINRCVTEETANKLHPYWEPNVASSVVAEGSVLSQLPVISGDFSYFARASSNSSSQASVNCFPSIIHKLREHAERSFVVMRPLLLFFVD